MLSDAPRPRPKGPVPVNTHMNMQLHGRHRAVIPTASDRSVDTTCNAYEEASWQAR
jgi:hypothetical protein